MDAEVFAIYKTEVVVRKSNSMKTIMKFKIKGKTTKDKALDLISKWETEEE